MILRVACAVVLAGLWAAPAMAGAPDILARVKASGVLQCGAFARPDIAEMPDGTDDAEGGGLAVALCRRMASSVLGPEGRIAFTLYDGPEDLIARRGDTDLVFVTEAELAAEPARAWQAGPAIARIATQLMVPGISAAGGLADLGGRVVCLMIGSDAQSALEQAVLREHVAIMRLPFEEDVEMLDAFNAGRCDAVVADAPYLAGMRAEPGINRITGRVLPDVLAVTALIAATPAGDAAWAAQVTKGLR